MSDNLKLRAPVDSSLIGLGEAWEVTYWTKTLGKTKEQIQAAIKAVGSHSAAKVRAHFAR